MGITEEEENYIRLMMFSTDLSSDVVKAFVESSILSNYNNDFVDLLESHKHDLFHGWVQKVNCCECSEVAMGAKVTKKDSLMNEAVFVKLYENHGSLHSDHRKRGINGFITQHCLCRFSVRTDLKLEELDLNTLSIIIFDCVKLNKRNREFIKTIRNLQWEMMSKVETKSVPIADFSRIWNKLKLAVNGLTVENFPRSYGRIVEKQINLIKIAEVDKVNLDELLEKLNNGKEVAEYLQSVKKDESYGMQQSNIINCHSRDEGIELDLDTKNEFFSELLRKIRFDITHTALPKMVNGFIKTLGLQYCRFKLETPQTWDNQKIVAILNKTKKVHQFQIMEAKIGSLVIKTTANPDIMKDRETFQNAVRSFLEKLVEVCEIDTSVPATIPVEISISGGPFADTATLSNGSAVSDGAVGGISNGEGEVQFQIRSQECSGCNEKQETIDRLQKQLEEKDARIAELERQLAEMENSKKDDVDDVD